MYAESTPVREERERGARPSPPAGAAPPAPLSPLTLRGSYTGRFPGTQQRESSFVPNPAASWSAPPLHGQLLSSPDSIDDILDSRPLLLASERASRSRSAKHTRVMSATASSSSRDPSPRHRPHLGPPPPPTTTSRLAASALTGTTSGSATPSTSYGSFPPAAGDQVQDTAAVKAVEDLLRDKLSPATTTTTTNRASHQPRLKSTARSHRRRWTRSRERLLVRDAHGRVTDDVYDSDGDAGQDDDDDDHEEGIVARDFYGYKGLKALTAAAAAAAENDVDPSEPWRSVNGKGRPPPPPPPADALSPLPEARSRRTSRSRRGVDDGEHDKQWGVVKMELMAKTWGRKGFLTVYAG